jgi:TolA-binding protein
MSDPTRLFDGAGSDAERRLIGFARAEAPPPGSAARLFSALGIAGGVLAPAVSEAAALGSAAASSGAAAASGTSITLVTLVKWLAVGVAGGTLTATAARVMDLASTSSQKPAPSFVPPASRAEQEAAPPANETTLPFPRNAPLGTTERSTPPADERNSLREELALLERARRALAAGRSDEARSVLKRHREEFPSGVLVEEADVLRIEVLLARGETTLAEQAGRDFIDAHPASPHAPRVRDLLARAANDPKRSPRPSME